MKIHQETVCTVRDTKNGASPLWCAGSTAIMRAGDSVFISVPENDDGVLPLADRHIALFAKKGDGPFRPVWRDARFTREPAPLLRMSDEKLLLSLNPSERDVPEGEGIEYGLAVPTLAEFDTARPGRPATEALNFGAPYSFMDHSYRGMAADTATGELFITWQYVEDGGGKHCYLLRTKAGDRTGKLAFPVRACYHSLALQGGRAYVFAVSDVTEPVEAWRAFKREKTGIAWDYDFRNLYFSTCEDIETGAFGPVLTVDSREETCGLTRNLDMLVRGGTAYLVYFAKRIWHGFMRDKFFPETRFDCSLILCAVKNGEVLWRKTLDTETEQEDGDNTQAAYGAAFFERANGAAGLLVSKAGGNGSGLPNGWHIAENVLNGEEAAFAPLETACPPGGFHTARPRCGAKPSDIVDVLANPGEDVVYMKIEL